MAGRNGDYRLCGSAQAVNIAANAAFGGHNATVNGHVNNLGNLYFVDTFTVNGDVVNSSAMISGSDQPNNTLTIAGNYTGNDGHLYLNTQLGDDSSPTDKLIVTGDTAGSTTLHITNVNGRAQKRLTVLKSLRWAASPTVILRSTKGMLILTHGPTR